MVGKRRSGRGGSGAAYVVAAGVAVFAAVFIYYQVVLAGVNTFGALLPAHNGFTSHVILPL
jgi:hypothetical protein